MTIAIASVGLATAQGGVFDVTHGAALRSPARLAWRASKWATCHSSYMAVGVEPSLAGSERWSALARMALQDCFKGGGPGPHVPLLLASCNGAATGFDADGWRHAFESKKLLEGTGWAKKSAPVLSASCNSGLHALYMAQRLLLAGSADEAVVLAVDILSQASHDNFEVLRVLTDRPAPWQSESSGFIPGEAAVCLHLVRTPRDEGGPRLLGPTLGSDLEGHDGLAQVVSKLRLLSLKLILGQGTGPFQSDAMELAALAASVSKSVPLATPLAHFGHTLGASSLLSVALAALAWRATEPLPALCGPAPSALDGRRLYSGEAHADNILVTCRAMSGACGAAGVGTYVEARHQDVKGWQRAVAQVGPLMHSTLRLVASEAVRHRPQAPPDILVVRMDEPLMPEERARIGGRLLPSAVLELTPGFVPQLIARCWGFTGGAFCLVGNGDAATSEMIEACKKTGLAVCRVNLRGGADDRAIEWNA